VQFQIKRHLCYWGTLPEPDLSFMPLDLWNKNAKM
jgi:hypothetical protein